MSRILAIVLTITSSLICGLPGLGLICFGTVAAIGGTSPEIMSSVEGTPQDLILGVLLFLCAGLFLIFIPIAIGFFSFELSKRY